MPERGAQQTELVLPPLPAGLVWQDGASRDAIQQFLAEHKIPHRAVADYVRGRTTIDATFTISPKHLDEITREFGMPDASKFGSHLYFALYKTATPPVVDGWGNLTVEGIILGRHANFRVPDGMIRQTTYIAPRN